MLLEKNVGGKERTISLLAGGFALAQALRGDSHPAVKTLTGLAGLALLVRGSTGHCPLYSGLGRSSVLESPNKPQTWIERSSLVVKTIEEVRNFFRTEKTFYGRFVETGENNFELNLDDRLWMLSLSEAKEGEQTMIKLSWDDHVNKEKKTFSLVRSLKTNPRILELRKLKALIEIGEIPTIDGQSHGERSRMGSLIESLGNTVIEKIQSRTPLPEDPHLNQDQAARTSYLKEVNA